MTVREYRCIAIPLEDLRDLRRVDRVVEEVVEQAGAEYDGSGLGFGRREHFFDADEERF